MKGLLVLLFVILAFTQNFPLFAQEEDTEVDYATPAQSVCDENGENCRQQEGYNPSEGSDQTDSSSISPTINVYPPDTGSDD